MPGRHLPTFSRSAIANHNTTSSCYVTVGTKVYDVTSFLPDHPGGGDLIAEYGGKDVTEIMKDEISHAHSEAAYEVLDECFVGFAEETENLVELKRMRIKMEKDISGAETVSTFEPVPDSMSDAMSQTSSLTPTSSTLPTTSQPLYENTGMSSAEDLSRETDAATDYRTHKFLDLNRPLIPQVWSGGFSKEFYLEQVHRPRHYRGGDSAPLFGNFLEPLTKTAWWVVPSIWLPPVAYGTLLAGRELGILPLVLYWITGLGIWTFVEYGLHRLLFHIDKYVFIKIFQYGLKADFTTHGMLQLTYLSYLVIYLTTVSASRPTSYFMVFIITYPWTATVSLCHLLSSSSLQHLSGISPTLSFSTTGTPLLQFIAVESLDISAMI